MKVLTICQPWAYLITDGPKRVENREWKTKYRGQMAIHAGLSTMYFSKHVKPFDHTRYSFCPKVPPREQLTMGAIVGVCEVVDCVPYEVMQDRYAHDTILEWAEGPWCWILEHVVKFERPVPCRGRRGLVDLETETEQLVQRAMIGGAA